MKQSPMRVAAAAGIVLASVGLLIGILISGVNDRFAANRDFIEYWAAGQQLIHGENPYDSAEILRRQLAAGMMDDEAQITLSPPVTLCLLLPLGLVTPKTGLICWTLALIGSLLVSIWIIWVMNGRPNTGLHFCGYLFAPAVACLLLGQIGTFLLLAVALFLYLNERRPYIAGLALLPCTWKPHLFLPFFLVLGLWSILRRDVRILAAFIVSVVASSTVTLYFDSHIWREYFQMVTSNAAIMHGYVPTLSVTLRFLIAPKQIWLQYIPEVLACVWGLWYFWTRRHRWSWLEQGSWVLLVSAACSPYAWFTDEAILLPTVLSAVYRAEELGRSLVPIAIVALVALLEVCAFGHIASTHYLWTVPAWIGWYAYATLGRKHGRTRSRDANAVAT